MEQKPLNLGFLFGAGAEKCFGLPDGGEFAVKLFSQNKDARKEQFREAISEIINNDSTTQSYIDWLDYIDTTKNKISCFGKDEFKSVVISSVEQKKESIIKFCQNIDSEAKKLFLEADTAQTNEDAWNQFYPTIACKLGIDKENSQYNFDVKINHNSKQIEACNEFFKSETVKLMAAFIVIYETESETETQTLSKDQSQPNELNQDQKLISKDSYQRLKISFKVIMYMLTIICGEHIIEKNRSGLFLVNNKKLQKIFAEFNPRFQMDIGRESDHIFDFIQQKQPPLVEVKDLVDRFSILFWNLSYTLCAKTIDYQKLLDESFRYIMTPKTSWAKFTKIMMFLQAAYDVITESNNLLTIDNLKDAESYYKDIIQNLQKDSSILQIKGLGSSNYNDYYGQLVKGLNEGMDEKELKERFGSLSRLNGGVGEFYNPYKNSLVIIPNDKFEEEAKYRAKSEAVDRARAEDKAKYKAKKDKQAEDQSINRFIFNNQLITPFFLTQSGTKPMTSIDISCRYADLYRNYQEADAIVVIGFNFNQDDSHINTIFRDLVENKGKRLISLSIDSDHAVDTQEEALCKKLRIDDNEAMKRVEVLIIDKDTRSLKNAEGQGPLWLDYIIEDYKNSQVSKSA